MARKPTQIHLHMKFKYILSAIVILSLSIALPSCSKWKENRSNAPAIDHGIAQSSVHDLLRNALYGSVLAERKAINIDDCLSFTNDTSSYPKTVTLNYGSENCEGPYNIDRRGSLSVLLSKSLKEVGAVAEVSPQDYYVNDYQIEGTIRVTHSSNTSDGRPVYSLSSGELTISSGESFSYNWSTERVYTLTDGNRDLNFVWDFIFNVTGTSSGTDRDEAIYTSEITEGGLSYAFTCRWPSSGKEKLITEERDDREINYGDSEDIDCSNKAEVKRGKKEKTLDLR